ncbi:MAG: Gfo/Idh/MocA family oxidoreductase [Hyphomicrobiales bacterium]|nr:Gfo/Idh/MocA family oxidoreductase [Hyphomicrobiales bacterium]
MTIEGRSEAALGRRIRLGMVGGGEGAFIGAVHRLAARMDDHYEFVAGALSSTPEKARRSGEALGLDPDRIYPDYETMAKAEAARPDGIEAVAIVTPNHMHADPIIAFLAAGVHVISDKPLTTSLAEARRIQAAVEKAGRVFALTHNYTGYPLVRRAREMVQAGELGDIRIVQVEYPQEWLTETIETGGHKQAEWRVDPARSGLGGALGDIGTHAYNLADYVTGVDLVELAADLTSFGKGRALDDNAQIMLRYANGARGSLWVSQVAPGHENGLRLRVYGTKGSLHWVQANPNEMLYSPFGEPTRILTRAGPGSGEAASRVTRVPSGHPEGYLEGFANIYSDIALAIKAHRKGEQPPAGAHFPDIADGVKGLAFMEAAVASSKANGQWVTLEKA